MSQLARFSRKFASLLSLAGIASMTMLVGAPRAQADMLNLNGVLTITPDGTLSSCSAGSTACQDFSFSGTTVVNPVSPSDPTILGAVVTLPGFALGWNGTSETFNPGSGGFSMSYGANSLSGTINWTQLLSTGAGGYQIDASVTNMVSFGTDPIFTNFGANAHGNGILTFSLVGGPQNLSQLFANHATLLTSLNGNFKDAPELNLGSTTAALALLLGGLVVMRGRRRTFDL